MPLCVLSVVYQYLEPNEWNQIRVVARFFAGSLVSIMIDDTASLMLRSLCPKEMLPLFDDNGGVGEYRKFIYGPQVRVHFPMVIGSGVHLEVHGYPGNTSYNTAFVFARTSTNDDSFLPSYPQGVALSFHDYYSVMREGIHFISFEVTSPQTLLDAKSYNVCPNAIGFGLMRPVDRRDVYNNVGEDRPFNIASLQHSIFLNDVRRETWRGEVDYAFFQPLHGRTVWGHWRDHEAQSSSMLNCDPMPKQSIGLLLNLNIGTVSLYIDGKFAGIVKDGLSGDYVWMVYSNVVTDIYRDRHLLRRRLTPDVIIGAKKYGTVRIR